MEAETLSNSHQTLLIVDDEPLMTELFDKFMSRRGYRVLKAGSGADALLMLADPDAQIELVLTDQTMPTMDGLQLAKAIETQFPGLPIVLMTGHDPDPAILSHLTNVVGVVKKPCQNRVLAEQIREVLERRSRTGPA